MRIHRCLMASGDKLGILGSFRTFSWRPWIWFRLSNQERICDHHQGRKANGSKNMQNGKARDLSRKGSGKQVSQSPRGAQLGGRGENKLITASDSSRGGFDRHFCPGLKVEPGFPYGFWFPLSPSALCWEAALTKHSLEVEVLLWLLTGEAGSLE